MYELLLALGIVLFALIKARERFGLVVGADVDGYVSTDTNTDKGIEIFSTYPNTCPPDKTDLDAGLCYPKCKPGFYGAGPLCLANTKHIGVGVPVGLNPCPEGWSNDGLICREPITNDCSWKWLGVCWGKLRGGRLRGRLNPYCPKPFRKAGDGYDTEAKDCRWDPKRPNSRPYPKTLGVCAGEGALTNDHPNYIAGLCYRKCPRELPDNVPGMPYLCYKGPVLTYPRGVGVLPRVLRIARVWSPF